MNARQMDSINKLSGQLANIRSDLEADGKLTMALAKKFKNAQVLINRALNIENQKIASVLVVMRLRNGA